MQCNCLIPLYRSVDGGVTGNPKKGYGDTSFKVPGGQCMACRIRLSRDWAVRAMHETEKFNHNIFATITYSDENLPHGYTLHRDDIKKFHKRLRKSRPAMRMLYCGEYGDETDRPHYHGLYFNLKFDDQEHMATKDGKNVYRSQTLDDIWGLGHINYYDEITPQSAQYVAGYTKKKTGKLEQEAYQWIDPETGQIFDRTPEFKGQSNRPGIGYDWITKWLFDVYEKDQIIHDGKPMTPPRYYDKVCEKQAPQLWAKVRHRRAERMRQEEKRHREEANADRSKVPYKGSARHGMASDKILKSKKIARKEQ